MAKPVPTLDPTEANAMAETLVAIRREKIRRARARVPQPTYEQIAREMGCCVKTVYNAVTGDRPASP